MTTPYQQPLPVHLCSLLYSSALPAHHWMQWLGPNKKRNIFTLGSQHGTLQLCNFSNCIPRISYNYFQSSKAFVHELTVSFFCPLSYLRNPLTIMMRKRDGERCQSTNQFAHTLTSGYGYKSLRIISWPAQAERAVSWPGIVSGIWENRKWENNKQQRRQTEVLRWLAKLGSRVVLCFFSLEEAASSCDYPLSPTFE